ncbi:MAG: hypothetical protein ACJ76F_03625 [Bacteroidia bacterium]
MKRFLIKAAFLLLVINGFGQDTIYMKNGNILAGKVLEVSETELKYKKAENPDGPLYSMNKFRVALVQYQNGFREVFDDGNLSNHDVGRNGNRNKTSVNIVVPNIW